MSSRVSPMLATRALAFCAVALLCTQVADAGPGRGPDVLSPAPHRPWLHRVAGEPSYKLGALVIAAPWARATPGGAKVGGGYLTVTNTGTESDVLVGGTLPVATAVEVHEMSMTDGIMKMKMLEKGLEIKPGQTVELKPGGYHLMFTGLREALVQGQPIKGTLTFQKAGSIEVEFAVAPIGANSGMKHQH